MLEHPAWKSWPYTASLDSRQEIIFPEPEKPKPVATETLGPWMADASPENQARAKAVWEYVNDFVKARISANSYSTWVKPLRAVALTGETLIVRIPTPEFGHVGEKFGAIIGQALADPRNTDLLNPDLRHTDPQSVDPRNVDGCNVDGQNQGRVTHVKFVTQEELAAHPRARSA